MGQDTWEACTFLNRKEEWIGVGRKMDVEGKDWEKGEGINILLGKY